MQADNNWEDSVGKRLFDVEGELSPQAWENISRRIAPKPKRRPLWYWVPALLLFVALPLAFFKGNLFKKESEKIAANQPQNRTEKSVATNRNAAGNLTSEKPTSETASKIQKPAQAETRNFKTENNKPDQIAESTKESAQNAMVSTQKTNVKILLPVKENEETKPSEKPEHSVAAKVKKTTAAKVIIAAKKNSQAAKANSAETRNALTGTENVRETGKKTAALKVSENPEIAAAINVKNKANVAENGIAKPEIKAETNLVVTQKPNDIKPVNPGSESAAGKEILTKEKGNAATLDSLKTEEKEALATTPTDSAASENKTELRKEKKQFSWGLYGSPQYTFQRVFANTNDEVMILSMTNKNELESERLGYEFGFRGFYPLKQKLNLVFGFQFARINHHLKFRTASTSADSVIVNQQPGQLTLEVRNREQTEILMFKYFFGGLYSGVQYHLGQGWKLSGGLGANWLLWKNPDEEQFPIPTRNLNPYLSGGIQYQIVLSQNLTLQAGPTLQYFVKPVQKESAHYGAKPTTFGFTVGLLFNGKE